MTISVDAFTEQGAGKTENEDFIKANSASAFTILADGMGGHQAGGIASRFVASILDKYLQTEISRELLLTDREIETRLRLAIEQANLHIWDDASLVASHEGMGSTCVVTLLRNAKLFVAHVGDSRVYLYRDGTIHPVTKDHSFVQMQFDYGLITAEEMEKSPKKNLLTRSIGAKKYVEPDITTIEVCHQDIVVCCSDGLLENGGHSKLEGWLREALEAPADRARSLCVRARENGSQDDISVQLIYFKDDSTRPKSEKGRLQRMLESFRSRLFQRAG